MTSVKKHFKEFSKNMQKSILILPTNKAIIQNAFEKGFYAGYKESQNYETTLSIKTKKWKNRIKQIKSRKKGHWISFPSTSGKELKFWVRD